MTELDLIRSLNEDLLKKGCVAHKDKGLQLSRTSNYIFDINAARYIDVKTKMRFLNNFFSHEWFNLLNIKIRNKTVQDWLGLSNEAIEFAIETNPNNTQWTKYFGLDMISQKNIITDLNSDRATIVGYQPAIIDVFQKYFKFQSTSFYDLFKDIIKEYAPNEVFVLIGEDEIHAQALPLFAEEFGFTFGNISQYKSTKYNLVIRQIKTEDIIKNKKKYKSLIEFAKSGGEIINPLGSYLSGNKGWETILPIIFPHTKEWFPNSWLISLDNKVLTPSSLHYELDQLLPLFTDTKGQNHRKNYVLKNTFGAGGRSVNIGIDIKKHEWAKLIETVQSYTGSTWVFEEKLQYEKVHTSVLDWDGYITDSTEINSLDSKIADLNIILRAYSVCTSAEFAAEVFADTGTKINASGFTFPVNKP